MTSELERAWELVTEDLESRLEAAVERALTRVLDRQDIPTVASDGPKAHVTNERLAVNLTNLAAGETRPHRAEILLEAASRLKAIKPVRGIGAALLQGDEKPLGATTTGWTKLAAASFKSGRVTRTIRAGSPVKVKGLGRGGGIGSGYEVTGLEGRNGDVNVHVRKGREQERTVKLDRIIYVIPRRKAD